MDIESIVLFRGVKGVKGVKGVALYSQQFQSTPLLFFRGVKGVLLILADLALLWIYTPYTLFYRKGCNRKPLLSLSYTLYTPYTPNKSNYLKSQGVSI